MKNFSEAIQESNGILILLNWMLQLLQVYRHEVT